jgi:hypothetical protein
MPCRSSVPARDANLTGIESEVGMTMHRIVAIGFLLALTACSSPSGAPVYGAWQGSQPGADPLSGNSVDLVLKGTQNAQSGRYCIATALHDPSARADQGTTHWGGTWVRSQRAINGQSLTVLHLNNALTDDISNYALMPDGTLHALGPNGGLDPNGTLGLVGRGTLRAVTGVARAAARPV